MIYERTTTHVEHWDNAVAQARHAACAMLGLSQPFVHVPYFFSDVFDLSYEFWGDTSEAVETVTRGDMKNGRFSVWWLGENGLVIRFEAPAYQTGDNSLLVVVWTQEPSLSGLYRLPAGDAPALQKVELYRVEAIDKTLFTPDGSGILRDFTDQESGLPDVRLISTDASPDFSLLTWLGFKIAN